MKAQAAETNAYVDSLPLAAMQVYRPARSKKAKEEAKDSKLDDVEVELDPEDVYFPEKQALLDGLRELDLRTGRGAFGLLEAVCQAVAHTRPLVFALCRKEWTREEEVIVSALVEKVPETRKATLTHVQDGE